MLVILVTFTLTVYYMLSFSTSTIELGSARKELSSYISSLGSVRVSLLVRHRQ